MGYPVDPGTRKFFRRFSLDVIHPHFAPTSKCTTEIAFKFDELFFGRGANKGQKE